MLLLSLLSVNYSRVESRFPTENLLTCPARRALNFTEDWLLSVVSKDDWDNHYKNILTTDLAERERLAEQQELWGDPDEEGKGAFVLVRNEEEAPSSNFSFKPAAKP